MTRPAGSAGSVEPFGCGRGDHAGTPDQGGGRDALAADDRTRLVAGGDPRPEPHLDAEPCQRLGRPGREPLVEAGEQARAGLDQHDAGILGVDPAEVAGQRMACQLGDRTRHLDPGRSAAHHDEAQEAAGLLRVGCHLGALERHQHALADQGGVVDLLEAGGRLLPVVAAEIGVARAGGEDEVVVGNPAHVIDHDLTPGGVHAADPAELDPRVGLVGQDRADRPGDVGGRECSCRHLVQQRLEEVVVAPVDQDQVHRCLAQRPGRGQAAEAHAYDHHARPISSHRLALPHAQLGPSRCACLPFRCSSPYLRWEEDRPTAPTFEIVPRY